MIRRQAFCTNLDLSPMLPNLEILSVHAPNCHWMLGPVAKRPTSTSIQVVQCVVFVVVFDRGSAGKSCRVPDRDEQPSWTMLGVFLRFQRNCRIVNPALSIEQVQLKRVALADDHNVAVRRDMVLSEG